MQPDISSIAQLIGDRARASMLMALMSGKALTATELALEADIMPQTASSHLAKLLAGDLIVVRKQGRHKYFQLVGYEVAELLESMTALSSSSMTSQTKTGPSDPALQETRVCYDHLAGATGVALYDALQAQGLIVERQHQASLSNPGEAFFKQLGCPLDEIKSRPRPVCKSCLDWSERRSHLAGSLGQWILNDLFEKDWLTRTPDSRALNFSKLSRIAFAKQYGVNYTLALGRFNI